MVLCYKTSTLNQDPFKNATYIVEETRVAIEVASSIERILTEAARKVVEHKLWCLLQVLK